MADFCTSSRPVCPVSEGHSGGNQLVVAGLHGGGHTAQLWDHVDAGHPRASDHGTNLTLCNLYCRLQTFYLTQYNGLMISRKWVGTLLFLLFCFLLGFLLCLYLLQCEPIQTAGCGGLFFMYITQNCNQAANDFISVEKRNSPGRY